MSGRQLSVIVATRDRPELVADCLRSLHLQERSDFEIVVVDDGSEADVRAAVQSVDGPVAVRYVRQAPSGLSAARNRGAAEAAGDILAYLDDDAVADPGWAAAVYDVFDSTGCDGLAGRIDLRFEAPPPAWLTPGMRTLLAELDLGDEVRWLSDDEVPYGANCAVTRSSFDAVGGFTRELGRTGASLRSNEEVAFFEAVRRTGGRIAYAPGARVDHRVNASRLTREYFEARAFAQGTSDALLDALERGAGTSRLREWGLAARGGPILVKGLITRRETVSARVWRQYCRGRRTARRTV